MTLWLFQRINLTVDQYIDNQAGRIARLEEIKETMKTMTVPEDTIKNQQLLYAKTKI